MFGKFCNPLLSILNLDGGSSLLGTILFPADFGGPVSMSSKLRDPSLLKAVLNEYSGLT